MPVVDKPVMDLKSQSNSHKNTTTTTNGCGDTDKPKLDPHDPRVKRLVYSMYRDMLTNFNDDATEIINKKDPSQVTQDLGVGRILETIIRQGSVQQQDQGSGSVSGGGSGPVAPVSTSESAPSSGLMPPPPPPPPMGPPGAIPAQRLNSEIGPRDKGPPMALANAMMKDKKPFTYTPGGIDLSEIRSPRMAKRLQMNAAAEGVTSTPESRAAQAERQQQLQQQNAAAGHPHLPPAALAAMQPQMAFPVFPQGGFNPSQLSRTPKPSDYAENNNNNNRNSSPTPLFSSNQNSNSNNNSNATPPPPPPPQMNFIRQPAASQNSPNVQRSVSPNKNACASTAPPPPERGSGSMSSTTPSGTLSPSSPDMDRVSSPTIGRSSPSLGGGSGNNVGAGSIYIPPLSPHQPSTPTQQLSPTPPPSKSESPTPPQTFTQQPGRSPSPRHQTKAQAASQNLGSIYIPPIEQRPSVFSQQSSGGGGGGTASSISSVGTPSYGVSTPGSAASTGVRSVSGQQTPLSAAAGLPTPQLNKAPTPWMNSYNKMATKQAESPPYVNPANIMTPWGIVGGAQGQGSAPPPPMTQEGVVRTIPISIQRDDDDRTDSTQGQFNGMNFSGGVGRPPVSAQGQGQGQMQFQGERASAQQTLGRVIPIQIQRQESQHQQQQQQLQQRQMQQQQQQQHNQRWGRQIPVQFEAGIKRIPGPTGYNNPMGLYSNQNATEAYQQQSDLASGINNMSMGGAESPRMEPIQSKSMRVIQQAAENELKRYGFQDGWSEQQHRKLEMMDDDRRLMNLFRAQVDEGSSLHNTSEPRFRGAHIPSKAFKALQTTLPNPSPDAQQQSSYTPQQSQQSPMTHNIQIRMTPQSPTPQQQQQQNLPPSEQRVPEPKKYMGGNIPSRSFKMLQAMTADDDGGGSEVEGDAAAVGENEASTSLLEVNDSCDLKKSLTSSSCDLLSPEGSIPSSTGTSSTDLPSTPNSWPEDMDPYSYMSWYYWWYYASCYWAGYDMTGYEYPEGWDPEYPYYPQEFYGQEYTGEEYNVNLDTVENSGESQMTCDGDLSQVKVIPSENPDVPMIIIGQAATPPTLPTATTTTTTTNTSNDCDSSAEEEAYWSCADENETASDPTRSKPGYVAATRDDEISDEDEETEPEEDENDNAPMGVVEEPDTPTSYSSAEDSDATLVDDPLGVHIEEYNSSSGSELDCRRGSKNRLSTIDELTENSRISSSNTGRTSDSKSETLKEELYLEEEESASSSSSEDEMSSVSVIENKSDATRATESKREDCTSSSSSDSSDSSDEDEEDPGDTAVTVRLPLKLSFGKTKSYKDITTVLVGDSEVKNPVESYELSERGFLDTVEIKEDPLRYEEQAVEDEEPVVSFTISLSRQPSREEEKQDEEEEDKVNKVEVQEVVDIDFWGQIMTPKEVKEEYTPVVDFWGTSGENYEEEEPQEISISFNPPSKKPGLEKEVEQEKKFNFWDKSVKTIETRRFSNFEISEDYESDSGMRSDGGGRGEKRQQRVKRYTHTQKRHSVPGLPILNKNLKAKEERQEEIVVAMPEFNGVEKPQEPEVSLKHSPDFSAGWSYWDEIQENNNHEDLPQDKNPDSNNPVGFYPEEPDYKYPEATNNLDNAETYAKEEDEPEEEEEEEDKNPDGPNPPEEEYEEEVEDNCEVEVSVEIKLPSPMPKPSSTSEISGNSEDFSDCEEGDEENESEEEEEEQDQSKNEDEKEYPEVEGQNTRITNYQSDKEVLEKTPGVSDETSDESSKSSGTTIGRVAPTPAATLPDDSNPYQKFFSNLGIKEVNTKLEDKTIEVEAKSPSNMSTKERSLEIREIGDKIKLSPCNSTTNNVKECPSQSPQQQHSPSHHHHNGSGGDTDTSCTCHIGDRMARAESLLWRIERFLHESLSLGSEDDSGVMTDMSRQISDVDTDADNDLNDTEFLLSAAAAAKDRRAGSSNSNGHSGNCSVGKSPLASPQSASGSTARRRPQSEILVESTSKLIEEIETTTTTAGGVTMRKTAAERKALRYQRAKTHSRLFQLLQDECGKEDEEEDDDDDEEDYESENNTGSSNTKSPRSKTPISKTPISFSSEMATTTTTTITAMEGTSSKPVNEPINVDTGATPSSSNGRRDDTPPSRRSRLMPLPLKSILVSSLTSSRGDNGGGGSGCDSNSSPSGSSGVLSPTSPVTRDQLLADIINEFHLRHQESSSAQNRRRRFSRFPSKIFKVLQQEFGEEFYQTFDCSNIGDCGELDNNDLLAPCLTQSLLAMGSPSNTTTTTTANIKSLSGNTVGVHECTIHKSDSLKAFEEVRAQVFRQSSTITANNKRDCSGDSKQSTPDFLEVPIRRKRDFRTPKTKKF